MGFVWVFFGFLFGFRLGFIWVSASRRPTAFFPVLPVLVAKADFMVAATLNPARFAFCEKLSKDAINRLALFLCSSPNQPIDLLALRWKSGFMDVVNIDHSPVRTMFQQR